MATEIITVKEGVQQTLEKFTSAWNIHDAKVFAQVFAEDADFTNVFGQSFYGRPAIEAQHARIFATMFKVSSITKMEKKVRIINEDLAAVDVIWNMTGATDPRGNAWNDRKGLLVLTMKYIKEEWLILIMHNMDLPVIAAN